MTAICGIVSLAGAEIHPDDLNRMAAALAHHGPDRVGVLSEYLAGRQPQAGPVIRQPAVGFSARQSPLGIAANVRLDNRSDLFHKLGIGQIEADEYSDSALILAAYEKWGERCVERLLGDFSFAIWDSRNRRLFCCRDHMGLCPLFYYHDPQRFVFASEPKAIVAVPGVSGRVNRDKLATLAFPAARPLFLDQSWFANVSAVPAGSSLTLDENGIRLRRYWEPQLGTELPCKDDREILEAFQSLMFAVVTARLRDSGPVTALLSGGLDSSAVVSVAARVLERRNEELHVFSAVLPPTDDSLLSDERSFIDLFQDWPNVRINYVTAPGRGPFDDLEQLVWSSDTPFLTSRHYLYSAFAEAAGKSGSRVILEGTGGELGPSFHGDGYYAELLSRFRWPTLWRELRSRKRVNGDSLRQSFRADVVHPLIPTKLLNLLRPKIAEDIAFERQQPLQIRFAENQLAGCLSKVKVSSRSFDRVSPRHDRVQHRRVLRVQRKANHVGGFVGHGRVELRYPFMDKRLLEFCLSVPGDLKVRNGFKRYLIRAGLDNVLPRAIQWRTSKKPFSPDYLRRYNAQRKQAQTLLDGIPAHDPVREVVDVEKLQTLAKLPVADDERGTFAESVALAAVPTGIYLICFLRRFQEFRN